MLLILNKQQQNPCTWFRGSIKDENSFGSILADSSLAVAALCSPAISVVVVIPHIYSSVRSHNLESSLTFPVSFQEMHNSFTDTFPLEVYQPLQILIPSTSLSITLILEAKLYSLFSDSYSCYKPQI